MPPKNPCPVCNQCITGPLWFMCGFCRESPIHPACMSEPARTYDAVLAEYGPWCRLCQDTADRVTTALEPAYVS